MNFCSVCGAGIIIQIPANDDRERYVCGACATIHYQNPKIIVGCIPVWQDQVLLCQRAIEPRAGYWTIPAGFMELGETLTEAAVRETKEEAHASVEIQNLYVVINLPRVNQVYMIFRSRLLDLDYAAGTESKSVRLFKEPEIPWEDIAFSSIRQSLRHYYSDRERGSYPLHLGDILREEGQFIYRPWPGTD